MSFEPFTKADFASMKRVREEGIPASLAQKVDALRLALSEFPEFQDEQFRYLRGRRTRLSDDGLIFRRAVAEEEHWYFYNRGGDQDQVQLNVGMWESYIRVGLGFQIGRQVSPKQPAFHLLQTFVGMRPPLPFRDALYRCIERNQFGIEGQKNTNVDDVMHHLETYVVPPDDSPVFVFLGALWKPDVARQKTAAHYRQVFDQLLPFYQALILMAGRLEWQNTL